MRDEEVPISEREPLTPSTTRRRGRPRMRPTQDPGPPVAGPRLAAAGGRHDGDRARAAGRRRRDRSPPTRMVRAATTLRRVAERRGLGLLAQAVETTVWAYRTQ